MRGAVAAGAAILIAGTVDSRPVISTDDPALQPAQLIFDPGVRYAPAARRFQTVPGLARTPGGRLWATWYGGGTDEGPENYVMIGFSDDDGDGWSGVEVVIDGQGDVRVFAPVVWIDPEGRLWWFYHQSYRWWDGRAGVWAVTCENPDGDSPRWSSPRRIADGVMMNKPTILSSGDWLLPIAVWSHEPSKGLSAEHPRYVPKAYLRWDPGNVGTHVYRSRDDGLSFERIGTATIPNVRFDEHMIIERGDGSLWMLARTQAGISESVSMDAGYTWSRGTPSSIPHVTSRFFIRRLLSGCLLLVKHNPTIDAAWLQPVAIRSWRQRSHLTAYLSEDDGRTWKGGLLLDERLVVSYPDGDQDADGRIFIIYDYNRQTDKEITMAVFTEKDVLAGKLVDPRSRFRVLVNKATGVHPVQERMADGG